MAWQRTVGIDLALEGKHAAIICDDQCRTLNQKAFSFTTDLEEMEKLIKVFIPTHIDKKQVAIAMEPTSNAWIPVAGFFTSKGFSVFIIKTQKAFALREFFKKHAKTDRIDARTLAQMPFVDADGLNQLIFPNKRSFALEKLIKERANMVHMISAQKNKIYAHFQILNPKLMSLLGDGRFTRMAKAFYRKYANPLEVEKAGLKRFSKYLNKKAFGTQDPERLKAMFDASVTIAQLHKSSRDNLVNKELPYDMDCIQCLINDELDVIEFFEKKCNKLEKEIKRLYDIIDPDKILQGIKGFGGNIIAPAIIALSGCIKRFCNIRNYLGFIGLVSKTKQSSGPAKRGLKITKAGKKLLKHYYCLAAETARRYDVQCAYKYNLLIGKGLHHNQAICAVANMLARRVYSLLKQRQEAIDSGDMLKLKSIKYEFRSLGNSRISANEARQICLRDYPSKKERKRRLTQKKEKVAVA